MQVSCASQSPLFAHRGEGDVFFTSQVTFDSHFHFYISTGCTAVFGVCWICCDRYRVNTLVLLDSPIFGNLVEVANSVPD